MLTNKRRPYPNLEQLAAKCTAILGSDVSTSTIEKDIRAMREQAPKGYSAPIVYSKLDGGYVYSEVGFSIAELNLNYINLIAHFLQDIDPYELVVYLNGRFK